MTEAVELIKYCYGDNVTINASELRRFMRALYDNKTERPKSTDRKRRD